MTNDLDQRLIEAACEVRQRAHAPYSRFAVGVALQTGSGIFLGCNVENASFGLTVCAERVAVFNAIAAGQRKFDLLAMASPGGVPPCGACRQVLAEFCADLTVLLIDSDRGRVVTRTQLSALLPNRFELSGE